MTHTAATLGMLLQRDDSLGVVLPSGSSTALSIQPVSTPLHLHPENHAQHAHGDSSSARDLNEPSWWPAQPASSPVFRPKTKLFSYKQITAIHDAVIVAPNQSVPESFTECYSGEGSFRDNSKGPEKC
jgi:hypothetical protein